jgi:hypothetical protein
LVELNPHNPPRFPCRSQGEICESMVPLKQFPLPCCTDAAVVGTMKDEITFTVRQSHRKLRPPGNLRSYLLQSANIRESPLLNFRLRHFQFEFIDVLKYMRKTALNWRSLRDIKADEELNSTQQIGILIESLLFKWYRIMVVEMLNTYWGTNKVLRTAYTLRTLHNSEAGLRRWFSPESFVDGMPCAIKFLMICIFFIFQNRSNAMDWVARSAASVSMPQKVLFVIHNNERFVCRAGNCLG